jgi:thioredoxin reductase (NADPH)
MEKVYDMIVIGGGPGGYTAALYAARAGLKVAVLEKLSAGGQMALTNQVDNYPGFVNGIDGFELAEHMEAQAQRFGAESILAEVEELELEGNLKKLRTSEGDFFARTLVLATGANPRKLGLPREDALVGRGVNYCAACDGMRYRGKAVVVVGGGNSAAGDAMVLSRIAKKVIVIHRRDTLRATKIYHSALEKAENVRFLMNAQVTELLADKRLTGVRVKTAEGERELSVEGLFISVGRVPNTALFEGQLKLENGYILAGEDTKTNIPGVYAVGDVRTKAVRQVVTAAADGAVAVHMAEEYLGAMRN